MSGILRIYNKIRRITGSNYRAVKRFKKKDGDNTYLINYDLNEGSLVFDMGGYRGDYTRAILERYNCRVWVFEPVPDFGNKINESFIGSQKVRVFPFALEAKDETCDIQLAEDGSSVYKNIPDSKKISIQYKSVEDFFRSNKIENIDLMKINIEGGEYDLLESLINTGLIEIIDNILIQFHCIKGINSEKRMKTIQSELKKTHCLLWKFRPYVWESWKRKQ